MGAEASKRENLVKIAFLAILWRFITSHNMQITIVLTFSDYSYSILQKSEDVVCLYLQFYVCAVSFVRKLMDQLVSLVHTLMCGLPCHIVSDVFELDVVHIAFHVCM